MTDLAGRTKTAVDGGESLSGPRPPALLLGALVLEAGGSVAIPLGGGWGMHWRLAGLLPLTLGLVLVLVGDRAFKRAETPICPGARVTALVTRGVYRLSRNPMYLGMVLIAVGFAVLLGAWSALVVPWALALVLDRRFVRAEERRLAEQFGAHYEEYRRRVRRWI